MGDEVDKLLHELAAEGRRERPMSADEAFGAPPPEHYRRELARRAWEYIEHHHDRSEPLPDWVMDYLQSVARRIRENLGTKGGLSREAAHLAIGIDGKTWPKHSPEAVYLTIKDWRDRKRDDKDWVSGPEAGATKYVLEVLKDKTVPNSRVIDWYKRGKRSVEKEYAEADDARNPENEVAFDQMIAKNPPPSIRTIFRQLSRRLTKSD